MKIALTFCLSAAASLLALGAAAEITGDPDRGRQVYKKCASCHMVGPEARNRVGPPLNNIMSAKAGGVAGFRYSPALEGCGRGRFALDPGNAGCLSGGAKAVIPKTKMSFRGLTSAEDRIDLIAYLATFSGGSMAAQVDQGFTVSADILALEGDLEYGEYLSSECTTCHLADGDNDGIPGIVGWETNDFVTAMHAYKQKHRENPVMQMVTGPLGQ